ncbi:hypothetical protein EDD21DRAFT_445843 [Dissophora ornata]|nr:hypothetical protein EDD21DRAFT_445843 [Dissophora ornata]
MFGSINQRLSSRYCYHHSSFKASKTVVRVVDEKDLQSLTIGAAVDANIVAADGMSSASSSVGDCTGYYKSAILMLMLKVKGITTAASTSTCSSSQAWMNTVPLRFKESRGDRKAHVQLQAFARKQLNNRKRIIKEVEFPVTQEPEESEGCERRELALRNAIESLDGDDAGIAGVGENLAGASNDDDDDDDNEDDDA